MLKAVITTLALATSTAAMAQPAPYADDYNYNRDGRYNDGRYYDGHHHGDNDRDAFGRRRAVLMAGNVLLPNSYDRRSTYFPIEAGYSITRMRFDLLAGRTFIDSVHVIFADGHRETLPVRQMLSMRNPSFILNLPHGGMRGFFVTTAPLPSWRWGGGWQRASGATVNIVGLRE